MKHRLFACITALCLCLCCVTSAAAYTNNELCDMAKQHYRSLHGQEPPIVRVDRENGGDVVLQLCEYTLGHTATWDWYTVDRITGKGTDFMGGTVDLSPYAPGVQTRTDFPFRDVKPGDSRYESIRYVYQSGLFSGTNATTFSPNGSMNRAMLATVLYRLAGKPAVTGETNFQDIKSGSYYESAVIWASARGIVTGTSDRSFSPQNPITHEQLVVLLYRYAVLYLGMDSSGTASLSSYPDGGQVGTYAQKAMQWCASKGLISGGKLSPKSNATRVEVADMLYRLSKLPKGTGGYKQVLEPLFRNVSGSSYSSNVLYYDINGDGVEEVICTYAPLFMGSNSGDHRAAIYTNNGGNIVCMIDDYLCSTASNPTGEIGTIEKGGTIYLCMHETNGGEYYPEEGIGSYRLYEIAGQSLKLYQTVQYDWFNTSNYTGTITEGGQTTEVNTTGFLNWRNSWTWKVKMTV